MERKLLKEMFDNLLHIGNKTNYWNPKMKNYIYGTSNGVHVINLIETANKLEEVKEELKNMATEGKKILFVATKLQSRDIFSKLALDTGHFYVTEKWVPGLLTNFKTIKKRISNYLKLLRDLETGVLEVLTKKEKAAKMLELEKLDKAFKGLKELKKSPDVVFVVDGIYEKQAVKEANSLNLKSYAILNTNGDESILDNIIPANTNSVKSLEFIAQELKSVLLNIKVVSKPNTGIIKKSFVKKMEQENKTKVEKKEENTIKNNEKPTNNVKEKNKE